MSEPDDTPPSRCVRCGHARIQHLADVGHCQAPTGQGERCGCEQFRIDHAVAPDDTPPTCTCWLGKRDATFGSSEERHYCRVHGDDTPSRLQRIDKRLREHPYDGPFDLDDARWLVASVVGIVQRALTAEAHVTSLREQVEHLRDMANTNAAAAVLAVAPDDTPTRLLDEIEKRWQDQADINTDVQFLLAEVSRLRSSEAVVADVIDRLEKHTRALHFQRTTPDNVADLVDAICEHNSKQTAEVSRLREDWQKIHEAVAGKRDVPFDVTNLCALAEAQRSDSLSVDDFEASKERAEAEVTRLQQENALLKRSLSMLVESDTRHGEDGEHD